MERAFAALLPWAKEQRWFPADWQDADWPRVLALPLGTETSILLAQPYPEAPLLQIPVRRVEGGVIEASSDPVFWADWLKAAGSAARLDTVAPLGKEQSNTSVVLTVNRPGESDPGESDPEESDPEESDPGEYNPEKWVAKLFRVVYPGPNPDVEIPVSVRAAGYRNTPQVHAWYSVQIASGTYTLAVATDLVENSGTAWDYFRAAAEEGKDVDAQAFSLGVRLGELSESLLLLPLDGPAPTIQGLRDRVRAAALPAANRAHLSETFAGRVRAKIDSLADEAAGSDPDFSRVHGDLHLGQILHTADGDWQVIDFEGEPLRPLDQRVVPDFALRDLAGMLRSFSYAGWDSPEWAARTKRAFLEGFSAATDYDNESLLKLLIIEKALYELEYEARFRPEWLQIPLSSIEELLD